MPCMYVKTVFAPLALTIPFVWWLWYFLYCHSSPNIQFSYTTSFVCWEMLTCGHLVSSLVCRCHEGQLLSLKPSDSQWSVQHCYITEIVICRICVLPGKVKHQTRMDRLTDARWIMYKVISMLRFALLATQKPMESDLSLSAQLIL